MLKNDIRLNYSSSCKKSFRLDDAPLLPAVEGVLPLKPNETDRGGTKKTLPFTSWWIKTAAQKKKKKKNPLGHNWSLHSSWKKKNIENGPK